MTPSPMGADQPHDMGRESGFVLLAVIVTLLPLILIAGAASSFLIGNTNRMRDRIAATKAFAAAEAGLDLAIFQLNVSLLGSGLVEDLGGGCKAVVTVEDLFTNGVDDDGDTAIDEADEQVLRIHSVGEYRNVRRTLVAYLGVQTTGIAVTSALGIQHIHGIEVDGSALISGRNHNPDGTLGDPTYDLPGIMCPSSEMSSCMSEIDGGEAARIQGVGGLTPSVATGVTNIAELVEAYRLVADRILSGSDYENVQWGNAATNDYQVTYSGHDLEVEENSSGAGILIVDGDLRTEDSFRWTGVIIVTGDIRLRDNSLITGSIMAGTTELRIESTSKVRYSKQVVDDLNGVLGTTRVVLYNGWQRVTNK